MYPRRALIAGEFRFALFDERSLALFVILGQPSHGLQIDLGLNRRLQVARKGGFHQLKGERRHLAIAQGNLAGTRECSPLATTSSANPSAPARSAFHIPPRMRSVASPWSLRRAAAAYTSAARSGIEPHAGKCAAETRRRGYHHVIAGAGAGERESGAVRIALHRRKVQVDLERADPSLLSRAAGRCLGGQGAGAAQLTADRENTRIEMNVSAAANSATTPRLSHASVVTLLIPQMSCRPRPEGR